MVMKKLNHITIDKNVACGTMSINVMLNKHNYPKAVTIELPRTGICKANIGGLVSLLECSLSSIPKMLSSHLKDDMNKIPMGFFAKLVIEKLRGHVCSGCTSARAKRKDGDPEIERSCPEAIATAIEFAMNKMEKERKDAKSDNK